MDKKARSIPKEKPPNPLPLNHGDRQANWSRCSSFSSSSDDSTLFGSSHLQGSPLKRMANEAPSTSIAKRSRNSSGSSVSSNMSCVSDKEGKKMLLLAVPQASGTGLPCPDDAFGPGHLLDPAGSPFRHNLRRNIRKKTCSCDCSSTCTTFVVRRSHKIGEKTVEEETLISRKVETCSPTKKSQELHDASYDSSFSAGKSDGNRRRRSEVEKLYDSLHEIEWAKNFSPDNILRQINVRQAASVSMFGNSAKPNPSPLETKATKRRKLSASEQVSDSDAEEEKPGACRWTRSKTQSHEQKSEYSSPDEKTIDSPVSSKQKRVLPKMSKEKQESDPIESDLELCSEASSAFLLSSTPKRESESCSAAEATAETPCVKNLCEELPDVNTDVDFFDLAEESIRTIDACFRDVGAEVVISTCYEGDSDLPHLTPIKDTSISSKHSDSDSPPVLECYVNGIERRLLLETECNNSSESSSQTGSSNKCISEKEESGTQDNDDKLNCSDSSVEIIAVVNTSEKNEEPVHSNGKSENKKLLIRAGRRILKKYLKYLQLKAKSVRHRTATGKRDSSEFKESPELIVLSSGSASNSSSSAEEETENTISSATPLFTYKSRRLSKTVEPKTRTVSKTEQNVSYTSSSARVSFSHCKSNSLYSVREASSSSALVHNDERTLSVKESSSSVSIHGPSSSTVLCIRHSDENDRYSKSIPRPHQNFKFTCHYQSLTVYRYNGYSQVVLKLTRRNSIFLGVESLEELKDVMKKISQDPQCHTLILMGCGKAFCSGLDLLPLLGPQKNSASSEIAVAVKEFVEVLSAFQKPVVAVIDGPAVGLGVTILTHADISIASNEATFCMPQNSLGFFPEGGATLTLPRAVGSTVAMDLILRSRLLTATEAKDVGLVSEVVSAKDLGFDLVSRVKRLAENSLVSMETTKAIMKMRLQLELAMVLESEVKLLPQMWLSESCQGALHRALDSGVWIT